MGSVYLTWLADEFRRAGLRVVECDGWKTRSRSSGGYEPGRPWCVMWHHTASSTGCSAANDVGYMLNPNNDAYPTANIYVARDGEVWVMAAGATNTNGKGSGVRTTSKGQVPVDSMNTYAVGVEIGNNGCGESYSADCINAAFKVSNVVTAKCGLLPTDVIHHQAYAPDRKVDPATCPAVQGGWTPRSVTSSGTWSLDDLKAECQRRSATGEGGGESEEDMPLSTEDIDKIAEAVWSKMIDTTGAGQPDPQPARYFLQRTFLMARQYLGPFSGAPATDPTMLKQIWNKVK
jgi:hypothetical protein